MPLLARKRPSQLGRNATPIEWLWPEMLGTGMVTLLTSTWKSGKTTLLSLILVRMEQGGGDLGGAPVRKGRIEVITEEPDAVWEERRIRLGLSDHIGISQPFDGRRPTFEEWVALIDELAADPPDLVVIDPLGHFLPGNVENHASALLDALRVLRRLTAVGCAVLLLHHPSKKRDGGELSPRGSGALSGFADILAELDRPAKAGPRVRSLRTVSRVADPALRLMELSADGMFYHAVEGAVDVDGFGSNWPVLEALLEDALDRSTLVRLLADWPADHEKPSRRTLVRWLERAREEGRIERTGGGRSCYPYRYCLWGQVFTAPPEKPLERLMELLEEQERLARRTPEMEKAEWDEFAAQVDAEEAARRAAGLPVEDDDFTEDDLRAIREAGEEACRMLEAGLPVEEVEDEDTEEGGATE